MARRIRVEVVRSVYHARAGHLGGPLSAADLLAALYFHELRIRPDEPDWPDRDRFVLSKGHSSIGLYAAMALRGYFPVEELLTFDAAHSRLQGHPDMTRLPGLDMSTGSLGMGISAAMGMALGARLTGRDVRAFVMLGDGECQEGEVWEAAMAARPLRPRQPRGDRGPQQAAAVRLARRRSRRPRSAAGARRAGREVGRVRLARARGGRSRRGARSSACSRRPRRRDGRPVVIIAHTVKGKGVSFMEGHYFWHTRPSSPRSTPPRWPSWASPSPSR